MIQSNLRCGGLLAAWAACACAREFTRMLIIVLLIIYCAQCHHASALWPLECISYDDISGCPQQIVGSVTYFLDTRTKSSAQALRPRYQYQVAAT